MTEANTNPNTSLNPNQRLPVDGRAALLMVGLCAIWGMQQTALKAAAPDMAPVLQISLRSGLAAVAIAALVFLRGDGHALRGGTWKPGLAIGVLFALEYLFMGEGLRFTSASHMGIFLYTAPIFTALGLHVGLPEERLSPLQWLGIALAFAGVAVSFLGGAGFGATSGGARDSAWIGDLMGIGAGASWGATTLTLRFSKLSHAPSTVTTLYQLLGAFVLLGVLALATDQTHVALTPLLGVSLAFQTVGVSLVSLLVWFGMLRIYLASRLGVLSFMTPLFGVAFGVALLGERLEPAFIVGAAMVIAGILLVSGHEMLRARQARRAAIG
ncbi:DMT family transporter [Sphingomonas sp. IC081]|uniref:DMT family transporter n=1 Tax=Sphingomonas sp. IC081 TaxID=304378 RepID=UPI001157A574|nr:DMT family transporter [Sphingomonas sp. IC081]QDK31850.1 EamA family transporter [Sphingomonas sp. IC081]